MNTKLTLSLDQEVIKKMKSYAKKHQVSLSKLVENYFNSVVKKQPSLPLSSLVDELSGIVNLPNYFDEKKEYYNYLSEKYK